MNLQEPSQEKTRPTPPGTLESWKEIAGYLQRDAKTARTWEKEEGLPVHRHAHKSRSSVYAYASEIDRWRATRKVVAEPVLPPPLWRRMLTPSFALTLVLCLVMVGNGVRPQAAEAQQGQTRMLICSGPDCAGEVSPDGKSMVVDVNGGMGIRDLTTKKIHLLWEATPGVQMGTCCTEFSPDGSRVAYSLRPDGPFTQEKRAAEQVIVVNVDGTKSHVVYRGGASYAWSADGKRLLVEQTGQSPDVTSLLWVDIATGAVQKLPTTHASLDAAKVSPDGKYVAFNASKDGDAEENVYVMASDGSGETLVSPSAAYQEPIEWTPDGKQLVYAQFGASVDLWAVPFANGKVQGPAINPHVEFQKGTNFTGVARSGAIYYRTLSSTSDIFTATMDRSTGKVTSAPAPVPVGRTGANALPRWAPDSRRLLYNWVHPVAPPSDVREFSIYSFDTGKEERVARQAKLAPGAYCWSQDGTSIVFNSAENSARPEVAGFNLATGQITPLFPGAAPFALRGCVNDLAIGIGGAEIKTRSLLNGSERAVAKFNQSATPVLSHDGKSVEFLTPSPEASTIHLASRQGGPVRDLITVNAPAEIQTYWGVAWSPDDRFIYFAQRPNDKSPYELLRVPATGGPTESMGLKVEDLRDLNIAPDGTRIAFSIGAVNRPETWAIRNFLPSK